MSRRAAIQMSPEEIRAFVAAERVVTCASIGPHGRPHLMPLWYVPEGDDLVTWTYARSQKALNLERLPQATLQIEAGDSYEELRGVMFECDVEFVRETDDVQAIGLAVALRYAPGDLTPETAPPELTGFIAHQAPKRVGLRFAPTRVASWDHRKLASY